MLLLVELLGYRAGWEAGAARKMLERPVSGGANVR